MEDATQVRSTTSTKDWAVDTGASDHVTGDRPAFISYKAYKPGERRIKTASKECIDVAESGSARLDCLEER